MNVHHTRRVLTASVINTKAPQFRDVVSQDDFVGPGGLVDSLNDLVLLIRVVKEGAVDRKTPRVGQVMYHDHPLCAIHISSFDLQHQNSRYFTESKQMK